MKLEDMENVQRLRAFQKAMVKGGWNDLEMNYKKGDWSVVLDTSSWYGVSTKHNPGVFDVHTPNEYEARWTVNLIEHLCQMDDERMRLRKAIEQIPASQTLENATRLVKTALKDCYHTWLVESSSNGGRQGIQYCPICQSKEPYEFKIDR